MKRKYWFKRKTFGWGWVPATWQGWLVLVVWSLLFTFTMVIFDHEWLKNLIISLILTGILIFICFKKGEKPKWRWGN